MNNLLSFKKFNENKQENPKKKTTKQIIEEKIEKENLNFNYEDCKIIDNPKELYGVDCTMVIVPDYIKPSESIVEHKLFIIINKKDIIEFWKPHEVAHCKFYNDKGKTDREQKKFKDIENNYPNNPEEFFTFSFQVKKLLEKGWNWKEIFKKLIDDYKWHLYKNNNPLSKEEFKNEFIEFFIRVFEDATNIKRDELEEYSNEILKKL